MQTDGYVSSCWSESLQAELKNTEQKSQHKHVLKTPLTALGPGLERKKNLLSAKDVYETKCSGFVYHSSASLPASALPDQEELNGCFGLQGDF